MPPAPRPLPLPPVPVTLAVTALCYAWLWPLVIGDIPQSFIPWLNHWIDKGPVGGFAGGFGDYTPPYYYLLAAASLFHGWADPVTLIKAVSVVSVGLLCAATWRLLVALKVERPERLAACVAILPSVAANAALMGQCDALYAAPLVVAVAMAVERRHAAMLVWAGIGLAVKSQAAFIGPFFLALLIARRVPFRLWLLSPLAFATCMFPAWLAGWPAHDLVTIYFKQAGFFEDLSRNAPNIWSVVQATPFAHRYDLSGLASAAAVGAAALYTAHFSARGLTDRALVAAATLAPLIVVGLLPKMHERYFFVADILALAYAAASGSRRGWTDAALVQAGSTLGILAFLTGGAGFAALGALAMIAATMRIAAPLFEGPANDNPLPVQAA